MIVRRFNEAKPYEAPNHRGYISLRLFGAEAGGSKEMIVGLVNGLIWGSLAGLTAGLFYRRFALGAVMMAAIILNLMIAAAVGVLVPFRLHRMGRDPAQGSSVLLTFITDAMGFFLFLGLAPTFLL